MLMRVTSIQSLRHIAELTVPKRRAVQSERSVFLHVGGEVNACMRFFPEDLEKKKTKSKSKMDEWKRNTWAWVRWRKPAKKNKKLLRHFPAISDGFDLEKLKHPPEETSTQRSNENMQTTRTLHNVRISWLFFLVFLFVCVCSWELRRLITELSNL